MNPKLVEEVARAMWEKSMRDAGYQAWAINREHGWSNKIDEAQAAIRVCMARAAEIAESYEPRCDTCPSGVTNAIKREGGVT